MVLIEQDACRAGRRYFVTQVTSAGSRRQPFDAADARGIRPWEGQ
jgi:hypothetical protein